MKTAEVMVTGLEETVTSVEIEAALIEVGNCHPSEVKVGPIRPGPGGAGSAWVQCPVGAANKLAAAGRVRVGWAMARVHLLATRSLQCFRCLALGYSRAQCTAAEDIGDRCYRCGQPGHLAAGCSARPLCVVCAGLGRPAKHRCGGPACRPSPKTKRRQKGGANSQPPPAKEKAAEVGTVKSLPAASEKAVLPTPLPAVEAGLPPMSMEVVSPRSPPLLAL